MTQPEDSAPFTEGYVRPPVQPSESEPVYSSPPMYPAYPYSAPPYSAPPPTTAPFSAAPYSAASYSAAPYSATPYPAPTPYAYGAPPAPPTPTRAGLMIGFTAMGLALGLIIGATGAALVLRRPATTPQAQAAGGAPTESTPAATTSATAFSGDLRTLLLPAPTTSHPFAHPLTTDGTLTESQVASAYGDPAQVTEILEEDGFQGAAAEQWHDADDTEVLIKLYQFGSQDNARAFFLYNKRAYEQDPNLTDQSPIEDLDDSGCWVSKKADNLGFFSTTGVTSKDGIYMLVRVYQPEKQNRPIAITIMMSQYARLP